MRPRKIAYRSDKAQAIAETAAGLIALIPVFLVILDLVVVYMGYNANVSAARDAARAASSCIPETGLKDGSKVVGDGSPLYQRAKSVVDSLKSTEGYLFGPELKSEKPITLTDFSRPNEVYGGQFRGTVNVCTHVRVNLPVSIPGCTPGFVDLDAEASMPLTSVAESTIKAPSF